MDIFSFWGKADSKNPNPVAYHPLVYHCLDVAACGRLLLENRRDLLERLCETSGIDVAAFIPWVTFLLAIHDLGKFSDGFQNQIPELFQKLQGHATTAGYNERHDTLGYRWAIENITRTFVLASKENKEDLKGPP